MGGLLGGTDRPRGGRRRVPVGRVLEGVSHRGRRAIPVVPGLLLRAARWEPPAPMGTVLPRPDRGLCPGPRPAALRFCPAPSLNVTNFQWKFLPGAAGAAAAAAAAAATTTTTTFCGFSHRPERALQHFLL